MLLDSNLVRSFSAALLVGAAVAVLKVGSDGLASPMQLVKSVDSVRYTGTWFELAHVPVDGSCAGDVTSTYGLRADGRYEVIQRCVRHDGRMEIEHGIARRRSGDTSGAWLEVNFLPAWLRKLSIGWRDQVVVALDSDYRVAILSDRKRERLWVLSRVPEVEPERLAPMLAALRLRGYAVDRLVRTPQTSAGAWPSRAVNVMT